MFPWPRPPWHCLSHSYFSIDCYFEYVPSKGKRLWLALDGDGTVYCTGAKQQQKKKMEKKRHKKGKKKASLGMGQSVLWRLLIHLGALFLLTVCDFCSHGAPFCRTTPPSCPIGFEQLFSLFNNKIYIYIYKVEGAWISIFFVLLRFMILCGLFCFLFAFTLFCILVCTLAALFVLF